MIKNFLVSIIISLLFVLQVTAENENTTHTSLSEIEMSGVMDFISSYTQSTVDETNISLGQAELDFAKDLSLISSIEIAIAYNHEDALFELGAAILDLHLFGFIGERHPKGFQIV